MVFRSNYIQLAGLLLSLMIASCKQEQKMNAPSGPPPKKPSMVDAYIVKEEQLDELLKIPGNLVPNEQTDIRTETSGILESVLFKDGQKVKKGQLLAKINNVEQRARLAKLKVQLEIARNAEQRQGQLLKAQAIGQQEYDEALLAVKSLEADVQILLAELSKFEIRAPFNGTLGLRMMSPGAYCTPSNILVSISQEDQLKIQFSVPERYIRKISLGQVLEFTCQHSKEVYQAKLESTESAMDQQTRSLKVQARVMGKADGLKPGLFAEVSMPFQNKTKSIMVPSQSIIPQARDKKVAILKNGLVEFKVVSLGYRDSSRVEILSGLQAGDTLLITGIMGLKPGAPAKIQSIN